MFRSYAVSAVSSVIPAIIQHWRLGVHNVVWFLEGRISQRPCSILIPRNELVEARQWVS